MEIKFKQVNNSVKDINIIHLDRLEITMKHHPDSAFQNVHNPNKINACQQFGDIELLLNNNNGSTAYLNAFDVYCRGKKIGLLFSSSRKMKSNIEFRFEKSILYGNKSDWWYDLYLTMKTALGLTYNNIKYVEVALDSTIDFMFRYGSIYDYSSNNPKSIRKDYKLSNKATTSIMNDGAAFNISGKDNLISIYKKSTLHSEDFILDFFNANMMANRDVYRVESRMTWNYIKSLINKRKLDIKLETLTDIGMLTTLFIESVKTKLSYIDLHSRYFDDNRNKKHVKIFLLEGIALKSVHIPTYQPSVTTKHYKSDNVDESTLRQSYYRYLETGRVGYIQSMEGLIQANQFSIYQIAELLAKFNQKYQGERFPAIKNRMTFICNKFGTVPKSNVEEQIHFHICKKLDEIAFSYVPPKNNFFKGNIIQNNVPFGTLTVPLCT